jgi:hypothetical protein
VSPALLMAEAHEAAARRLRELDAAERAEGRDGIDQRASGLGERRHCRIVRDRIARKLGGAWIIGRRFFLSPAAVDEEREKLSTRKPAPKAEPTSTAARLERRLGLVAGGSR